MTSINFDTKQFLQYKKKSDETNRNKVALMNECCSFLVDSILSEEGMRHVSRRIDSAVRMGKNGTNIFEARLNERIVRLPNGQLRRVSSNEMESGCFAYSENGVAQNINVDNRMGVSVIDLIKGPRNNPGWMKKNGVKTIPEILEDVFQQKTLDDIRKDDFSGKDIAKKDVLDYMKMHDIPMPKIYYHYNSRWGGGSKGKYAIELDWSGESSRNHPGFRAGTFKSRKPQKKNN